MVHRRSRATAVVLVAVLAFPLTRSAVASGRPGPVESAAPPAVEDLEEVRSQRRPLDYVVVTTRALRDEFGALARWRARHGLEAAVVTLETIRRTHAAGRDDAERIRLALKDLQARRGLRLVLLGGDVEIVPTRIVAPEPLVPGSAPFASDRYFACLDGDWDADGDGVFAEPDGDHVDGTAELGVGRAPVRDREEARAFVARTLEAEQRLGAGARRALLVAPDMGLLGDGAAYVEPLAPLLATLGFDEIERRYAHVESGPGAEPLDPASLRAALERGHELVVFTAVGAVDHIEEQPPGSDPRVLLTVEDVRTLDDDGRRSLWVGMTSNVADVTAPECLAEALLRSPGGGAFAVFAPASPQFAGFATVTCRRFLEALATETARPIGEAAQVAPEVAGPVPPGWRSAYVLLGDPGLPAFAAAPAARARGRSAPAAAPVVGPAVPLKAEGRPWGGARIGFTVPAAEQGRALELAVFDLAGRRLRTLLNESATPGPRTLEWDGRDERGRRCDAGLYFVRLEVGGRRETAKLLRLRP